MTDVEPATGTQQRQSWVHRVPLPPKITAQPSRAHVGRGGETQTSKGDARGLKKHKPAAEEGPRGALRCHVFCRLLHTGFFLTLLCLPSSPA